VAYEVKRLYYSILQSESALDATEHSASMLRELGRMVGERVIRQAALKADVLDVDARLARVSSSG
jgi:outer membrane protein TolC